MVNLSVNVKERLIHRAIEARRNSYSPYSNFKVGAALLTQNGTIYSGCNFENVSFGAGTCGERVALGSALSAGEREFVAIAVCGGNSPLKPCGICRQALLEFGDMLVICTDSKGERIEEYMLSELLPCAFSDFVSDKIQVPLV